jgi:signal peptidase I
MLFALSIEAKAWYLNVMSQSSESSIENPTKVESGEAKSFAQKLVQITESILSKRARTRMRKKLRMARKHPIIDWIEAFLWAAMVVLIINQYLLQAYQIPSPSMRNTLLEGDRIFVDKFSYGPEILPGLGKLSGIEIPSRGQVLCFENPRYQSGGPAFMILQRVLYMLTLSLVDIDKEGGEPRMYLLIKRAVGVEGDQWRYRNGFFDVKVPGEKWLREDEFKRFVGTNYKTEKTVSDLEYRQKGLALSQAVAKRYAGEDPGQEGLLYEDPYWTYLQTRIEHYRRYPLQGQDRLLSEAFNGWYVPKDFIMPLGDNRDHSQDGRYFGPVPIRKVLGKALLKYWPISRIGRIQ